MKKYFCLLIAGLLILLPTFTAAQNLKLNYSTYLGGDRGEWTYTEP